MFTNHQTLAQYVPDNSTVNKPANFKAGIDFDEAFGTVYFTATLADDGIYSDIHITDCKELIGFNNDGEESSDLNNVNFDELEQKIERFQEKLLIEEV